MGKSTPPTVLLYIYPLNTYVLGCIPKLETPAVVDVENCTYGLYCERQGTMGVGPAHTHECASVLSKCFLMVAAMQALSQALASQCFCKALQVN